MIAALSELHLLRPGWLWMLLALPLIAWTWHLRRRRSDVWREVVDPQLLPHLLEPTGMRRGIAGVVLWCCGWSLAVLALAGPSWRSGELPRAATGRPMVLALDLSAATLASDLPPSRLLQARAALAQLLRDRNGQPTALLAYAGDAFTVSPLTVDTANIALFLDALAPDVMPEAGSRAGRAIVQAMRMLVRTDAQRGDIVLLTDHVDDDALAAAARAADAGYRVWTVGMGTPAGAPYRNAEGGIAHARLDAGRLQALARAGDGRYLAWTQVATLADVSAILPRVTGDEMGGGRHGRRDEGYWLLLPLMLLALFAFRRNGAFAVLAICLVLPIMPVRADAGGMWQRADQVRHARMREGVDAYRDGDDAAALQAWAGLPGADAAYNRGNALARQGHYADAVAAYEQALREQPDMADARVNRDTVLAAMRRQSSGDAAGGGRSGSDAQASRFQDPARGQDAGSTGQGGQGGEAAVGGVPKDGGRSSQQTASTGTPNAGARAADAATMSPAGNADTDADVQRAADAAQRRRMTQALAGAADEAAAGSDSEAGPHGQVAAADAAADVALRERRQAGEAWLRRIGDDPGGLLRARFRLEHERRIGGGRSQ